MSSNPGCLTVSYGQFEGAKRCPIMLGTSGYSYTEWVDSGFYPPETKTQNMLELYANAFSTVELNYTWYQMARAEAVARMVEKSPPHFRFAAKLTRTMTHEREDNWREQLRLYRDGIAPLRKRLVAVLVQLPPDFDRTMGNRQYLAALLDGLYELPVAVEFRHASWAVDSVFKELERRKVTMVTVDEPELPGLFPTLDVVTNPDLFYVRFHGRNTRGWRSGNMQKKFDYDYSSEELQQWCQKWLAPMTQRAERGVCYFNNHVRAQAPKNAQRLYKILTGSV
ncbi:DUF72 domain-containing protein [Desulfosediminicola flagellatus]|uniref:DUF72 domain-containing protein n=1 Tax=Desulfosediminicola flagellatus TaxID=2569541 RepID=UPI0010ABEA67|nr:DUF72 domain-containing protein [Desulfosediminicola flagellatus]